MLSAACVLATSFLASSASAEEIGNPKNLPSEGIVTPQPIDNDKSKSNASGDLYPLFYYKTTVSGTSVKSVSEAWMTNGNGYKKADEIKRIYAKARAYKWGSLVKSDYDDERYSSYAGITVDGGSSTWGIEGYGNHIFEKDGYMTVTHESYDK